MRPAGAPRRFAFRHPVVRHAVYAATPGGWRLGAHARAAEALERRGAGPVERAHHVEHAARPGDEAAIALLAAAAAELQSPAPATAARFHAAALRLLPEDRDARRATLQARLADAQAAAGDPPAARATLVDALRTAGPDERLALTVALANQEWWLGGHEDARRRLHVALGDLPAEPSPDRIRLRLALGLTALLACDLGEAAAHCSDARDDARAIGDPVFELAALAAGRGRERRRRRDGRAGADRLAESAAALERLSAGQLATRLPAFWMHGRARRGARRLRGGARRPRARRRDRGGHGARARRCSSSPSSPWRRWSSSGASTRRPPRARRASSAPRLAGNPRMLLWAHCALASARLAAGDVAAALRHAERGRGSSAPRPTSTPPASPAGASARR